MNVLIIGNLGYIGPVVVDHLQSSHKDFHLFGYDIGFFQGNLTTSQAMLPENKLKAQYYGDVRQFETSVLKNIDAVVYLAAISNDPMGKEFEKPTYDINQKCAVTIALEAKRAGVKSFVYASSCSVYGLADVNAKNELSEINPLTAYAKSKTNAEKDLKAVASEGFKVICLRFATACGISPRLRLDLVLNDFVACALTNKRIEILSDGKPWRPLINVKDMARAIEWGVVGDYKENFLVVNVGSDDWNYQVIDLARAVQKLLPGTEIFVNPNAQPDNRSYKVDFSLFHSVAKGYTPEYDLETTVKELIEGLKAINFDDKNFRNSNLIRLKTLKDLIDNSKINKELVKIE